MAMNAFVHSLVFTLPKADKVFGSMSPLHPHHISAVAVATATMCPVTMCQTLCCTLYSYHFTRDSEISTIITFTLKMRTVRLRQVN